MEHTIKTLDRETQLLISTGAAVAAGCMPCLTSIVEIARSHGIDEWKLKSAAKTGQFIKDKPLNAMKAHSDELLGTHFSGKSAESDDGFCPLKDEGSLPKPAAAPIDDAGTGTRGCGCS